MVAWAASQLGYRCRWLRNLALRHNGSSGDASVLWECTEPPQIPKGHPLVIHRLPLWTSRIRNGSSNRPPRATHRIFTRAYGYTCIIGVNYRASTIVGDNRSRINRESVTACRSQADSWCAITIVGKYQRNLRSKLLKCNDITQRVLLKDCRNNVPRQW